MGGVWRRGRKAAGSRGDEPAATPTPQDARQVAPGPRAAGASGRMAPRRREPRAAPRRPASARPATACASRGPAGTIFPPAHAPGSHWAAAKLCLGPMLIRQCPDGASRGGRGRRRSRPPAPPHPPAPPARAHCRPKQNKSGGAEGCKLAGPRLGALAGGPLWWDAPSGVPVILFFAPSTKPEDNGVPPPPSLGRPA